MSFLLSACAPDWVNVTGGRLIKEYSFNDDVGGGRMKGDCRYYLFASIADVDASLTAQGYKRSEKIITGTGMAVYGYNMNGNTVLKPGEWNLVFFAYVHDESVKDIGIYASLIEKSLSRPDMDPIKIDQASITLNSVILVHTRKYYELRKQ